MAAAAISGVSGAALAAASDEATASLPIIVADASDRPVTTAPSAPTPSTAAIAIVSHVRRR